MWNKWKTAERESKNRIPNGILKKQKTKHKMCNATQAAYRPSKLSVVVIVNSQVGSGFHGGAGSSGGDLTKLLGLVFFLRHHVKEGPSQEKGPVDDGQGGVEGHDAYHDGVQHGATASGCSALRYRSVCVVSACSKRVCVCLSFPRSD